MQISRKYTFKNGTKANAQEVNAELDQILNVINGNIESDNVLPGSLTKDLLAFVVSENWQDPVETYTDLDPLNARDYEARFVKDEQALYVYYAPEGKYKKLMGVTAGPEIHGVNGLQDALDKKFDMYNGYIDPGTATNPGELNGAVRFVSNGTAGTDGLFIQYVPATDSENVANRINITSKYGENLDLIQLNSNALKRRTSQGIDVDIFDEENLKPDYINVKSEGVLGDGTVNENAKIQAIVDNAAVGQTIFFPAGTYVIDEIKIGKKVDIVGAGRNTVFLKAAQDTVEREAMLHVQRPIGEGDVAIDDLNLRNFVIDGNRTNQTQVTKGLSLRGVHSGVIENVMVKNTNGNGFHLDKAMDVKDETGTVIAEGKPTTNTRLINCWTLNNEGHSVHMDYSCMDDHVIGGDYGSGKNVGIFMGGPSCSVRDAVVWAHRDGHGLHIVGRSCQVFGSTIEGHAKHGILVEVGDVAIVGNKIYANANALTGYNKQYDGIYANYADNLLIASNTIYHKIGTTDSGQHRHHINLIGYRRNTIVGNFLRDDGGDTTFVPVKGTYRETDTDFSWLTGVAKAHVTADTALAGFGWTAIPWTASSDGDAMINGSTITTKVYGHYEITANIMVKGESAGQKMLRVVKPDGTEERMDIKYATAIGEWIMLQGSTTLELNGDASISIEAYTGNPDTTFSSASYTGLSVKLVK